MNGGIVLVKNIEWLKQRTLHVKGLHPEDLQGLGLEDKIKDYLQYTEAKLLGRVTIFDYQ